MNKKGVSDNREHLRWLQWFLRWFTELPPRTRVLVVSVVLLGIIFAILPQSLFHSFNCEVQNLPQSYRSANGYFIDNQVIVVGRREDVDAVIGTPTPGAPTTEAPPTTSVPSIPSITPTTAVPPVTLLALGTPTTTGTPAAPVATATPVGSEKVILNFIEGCDLSYLDSRKDLDSKETREPRRLVMRLYEIPKGSTVGNVITEIGVKAQGREIFTDPNYLTRLADLPSDPCALPGDGSGGGGRPFGGPGTLSQTYDPRQAEAAFKTQWAFAGSPGINLLPSSIAFTGSDVRVGVFDTSPYRISYPFIKRVGEAFPSPLRFTNWDTGGTTMVSNHGLFVASLIHRIAPNSSIQLIRVLYEDGCGELWTLNKGLEDYKSQMSAWQGDLDDTVINMSLGIRLPEPQEDNDTGAEQDSTGSAENDSGPEEEPGDTTPETNNEGNEVPETLRALFNEDLGTLKSLIAEADKMGAIIVASAGNDSTKKISNGNIIEQVVDMQVPANLDEVIGVAATNKQKDRSCYSNRGDVAAPGGNGGVDPDNTSDLCVPRAFSWDDPRQDPCTDMATCEYGLISLVQTRYGPRYVLWSGTSFAAPLVSGLAALAYEEMTHDQVKCVIEKGSTKSHQDLGWGVIDINTSLSSTVITQCRKLFPSTDD